MFETVTIFRERETQTNKGRKSEQIEATIRETTSLHVATTQISVSSSDDDFF